MTEPENDAPEGAKPTEPDADLGEELDEELDATEADLEPAPGTELDEDFDEATESEPAGDAGIAAAPTDGGRRRGAAPAVAPVPERAHRVDDRISKVFVLLTVGVFAVILLNGVFFGVGGIFTPYVSPTPELTASPSVSVSASPSVSPSASGSVAPSASGSAAPSVSGSTAPSASPSVSPSPS